MRELLFKGQKRKYGEKVNLMGEKLPGIWVYGGVFQPNTRENGFSIIYSYDDCKKYSVYSDTVCQYTGTPDIKGRKVFEGDIFKYTRFRDTPKYGVVKYRNTYEQHLTYNPCGFVIEWLGKYQGLCEDLLYWCSDSDAEIVGNIYDNPELLGE